MPDLQFSNCLLKTPYRIKKEIEGGNKKGEKGEEKVLTGAGGDDKIIEHQKAARKKEKKA